MTETSSTGWTQQAPHEAQVLANIPPTTAQRRVACVFVFILLAIFAGTWPFKAIKLPEIRAFVPSLAAALFVADSVAAALLFAQFTILRQWALLIIANGYLFSALIVVAHALAFPGAFAPNGLFVSGSGLQSAVWLYWIWHSALPLSVIGYALLKDSDHLISTHSTRVAIMLSVLAVFATTLGIFWFVTTHENILPITFVDVQPISFLRQIIGGVTILVMGVIALYLLWVRRRSLLDQWLLVAVCAFVLEVLFASVLSGARYTLGWYAGRFYQFTTATVVMVVLLAEMTRLYAHLARTNMMLQHERMMLQRERDNRLTTLDAMAASIAHEVRQPLAAIATRGDTALRFLGRTPINVDRVRANLSTMVSESRRASEVFDNIRALFGGAYSEEEAIDLNEIVRGALRILRADLEEHDVTTRAELTSELPRIMGHGGQMQEVMLNLIHNAMDAMDTIKDGHRILTVRTGRNEGHEITVAIEDSGPGIEADKLGTIFDPFVTTKSRGMGLGLAICRMTIERHGGQLSASSRKNEGALFEFVLPVRRTEGGVAAPL